MQVVRFSVRNGDMAAVLAGVKCQFEVDSWRVDGRFWVGSEFVLMDDWQSPAASSRSNKVFGLCQVVRMRRKEQDFSKTSINFELIKVY